MAHMQKLKPKGLTGGILWFALLSPLLVGSCNRTTTGQIQTSEAAPLTGTSPLRVSALETDGAEPTTASAQDGSLYVAWVSHGEGKQADIMLARFTNDGKPLGPTVRVNQQSGQATAWRGDPPSLAVRDNGSVYVVWTRRNDGVEKHATDIYLSVSHDYGKTFATEVKVNDDTVPNSHGMHALAVGHNGRVYVSWLDERGVHKHKPSAKAEGHHSESNRELYLAYSDDGGRTISTNRKVAKEVCPCCKTAMALGPNDDLYLAWRQVLPGDFRHIAVSYSPDKGETFSSPQVVSDDQWVLRGCPVSGPALTVDTSGKVKVVWYAAGDLGAAGVYSSESNDNARSFSARRLVAQENIRGTPTITGKGNAVAIWESVQSGGTETKVAEVGVEKPVLKVLAHNAEVPAGVFANNHLFVAFVTTNEKRSVWLVRKD
jgi:hypothetical protein